MAIELPFLTKPRILEPCSQCGLCCSRSLCEVAERLLDDKSVPCTALILKDGKYWCGMMLNPAHYTGLEMPIETEKEIGEFMKEVIGAGLGCGMPDSQFDDNLMQVLSFSAREFRRQLK